MNTFQPSTSIAAAVITQGSCQFGLQQLYLNCTWTQSGHTLQRRWQTQTWEQRQTSYPQAICFFLFCAALKASSSCLPCTKSRQSAAWAIFTAIYLEADRGERPIREWKSVCGKKNPFWLMCEGGFLSKSLLPVLPPPHHSKTAIKLNYTWMPYDPAVKQVWLCVTSGLVISAAWMTECDH